jgi:hypothetical protein
MSKKLQLNEKRLKNALELFREYSKEERFKEDMKDREERKKFFQEITRKKLTELSLSQIIKKLWASRIWGNKDYLVEKIIKTNGIKKLNLEFAKLIAKKGTPGQRYDNFLKNIKGMGPAMVTEILCHLEPKNAGIWNDKAKKALAWLEIKNVPYNKYRITGKEYDDFNQKMKELVNILKQDGYKNVDLLFLDYFFWEIYDKILRQQKISTIKKTSTSRHEEILEKVAQIGSWLGFETETEKQIATGARVDVVWRARIANLGAVSYVFEIQEKGSIDSLIMNLQRAQNNPTVQKLIVVSNKDQIEKIKGEIKSLPESFRKAVNFWDTEEVEGTYQSLEQATESIQRLHLLEE